MPLPNFIRALARGSKIWTAIGMIPLPQKPKVILEEENRAVFEIEGLYPGYGQTIGNSIRRVLLSSLEGASIVSVKLEGAGHEFTALEGLKEDLVDLTLNLKLMRFRLHEPGQFTISLSASGERDVKGKDFKTPSQVEVVTPDTHIATLTSKKSKLNLEAVVESGLGYVPVEARSKEKVEVGIIALDAAFSPVRLVNYEVENMRIGDRTDYNKLRLHIETDGSIAPREALQQAIGILVKQFGELMEGFVEATGQEKVKEVSSLEEKEAFVPGEEEETTMKVKLDTLKFSSRTLNALREAGIKTVSGLSRKKESSLREIEGLGEKGMQEIKKALGNFGITLKQ